ncbi:PREDICTED: uncharacterized protein LOC105361176 [Ceratosolen solmsi marchali]|uniref:Uncharacterized protein LOC105361176 n=1 Tax=Ceratosolen solmsi marchali TaxID=326594 RepID=A0AAJ7DU61_9HYME|nr:PREDICTED: uncharacterized protein LOC105361176 [Ceratosolen solmsi marchali]
MESNENADIEIDDYEEVNEDTEKTNVKSNSDDFDFLKENVSAFVSEIIRYKLKDKHKPTTSVPSVIKKKFNSIKDDQHKISINSQKQIALEYLNEAIVLKASDHRHYLNRCYCYLRMNKYNLALEDAKYVLQTSKDNLHIYLANVRAGQASFGLQKYYEAEIYLTRATFIEPENYHTQRELMRVKLANLVEMGFQEKDALFALELHSSTTEAIEYLIENNACSNKSKFNDFEILHNDYNNMIYSSDDDEKPSTVEILNKIMNYKAGDRKLHNNLTNSPKAK